MNKIINILFVITIVLVILKLLGHITISWWIITIVLWFPVGLFSALILLVLLSLLTVYIISKL